jgi:DNA-binding transcriptional LysR family regulator
MRALERSAGCRLLNNVNKRVMLTDAGEALLQHAQHVLEEMKKARTTLVNLNKWGSRRLRVSAEAPAGGYFLTNVLVEFHQKFPRVMMSVDLHNCCDAHALLAANRADLVFTEKPLWDGRFEFFPLFADRFQIIVNPSHHWAAKGSVALAEFARAPFILHRNPGQSQMLVEEYLAKNDVVLNTAAEMDSLDSVKEFVRRTQAHTILPTWAVVRELKEGSLAALPLGRKPIQQTWGFTHWRERPFNHSEASLLELCRCAIAATAEKTENSPAAPTVNPTIHSIPSNTPG